MQQQSLTIHEQDEEEEEPTKSEKGDIEYEEEQLEGREQEEYGHVINQEIDLEGATETENCLKLGLSLHDNMTTPHS